MLGGETCASGIRTVGGGSSGGGGGGSSGAGGMMRAPTGGMVPLSSDGYGRRRSRVRCNGVDKKDDLKLTPEDESNLIQMLNDKSSELYRLFSAHNPNKSPQQCYLDLKYSSPDDLESRSLYEKVLKYAQLHRRLGRKIKRENPKKQKVESGTSGAEAGCSRNLKDEKPATDTKEAAPKKDYLKSAPFSQFVQEDGCNDRCKKYEPVTRNKKTNCGQKGCGQKNCGQNVCNVKIEKKLFTDDPCKNPLFCENMKSDKKVVEEPDDVILKSYQKALNTQNLDTGMRLALLDVECNKVANACGDGLKGCGLPSLMKPPARQQAKCFVSRPIRAKSIQHSLSSVSSIEVHKTNTSCSLSSTSISISTVEVVSKDKN